MTDEPDFLDHLARQVARLSSRLDEIEQERLEALLGGGVPSRAGDVGGVPSLSLGAGTVAATMGNVQPLYGHRNLLIDPTFERMGSKTSIGTTDTSTVWRTIYALVSGSAPVTRSQSVYARGDSRNPFNSESAVINLSNFPAGGGTTTFWVFPEVAYDASIAGALPYLVAACRIADLGSGDVFTNLTSVTVRMQIANSAGTTVAEGPTVNYADISAEAPAPRLLWVAYQNTEAGFQADDWRWRLRIDVESSGAGGSLAINIGEPQLHFAYSPDPAPYAPLIGSWNPSYVVADTASSANVLDARLKGDTQPRLQLTTGGGVVFGSGSSGLDTVTLRHIGANLISVDKNIRIDERLSFFSLAPATITADQNDYNPPGGPAGLLRLSTDATPRTITGMVAAANDGDMVILVNANVSTAITLSHQDAASAAANRFIGPNSADVTLRPGGFVWCLYDLTSARWRVMGQ